MRRIFYVSHMVPTVHEDTRTRLLKTCPFSGYLFNQDVLDEVLLEHKSDVQLQSNVNLANTIAKAIPAIIRSGVQKKAPKQSQPSPGMAAMGSPLTGPHSSASAAWAPHFAKQKFVKRGRGRGGRGRGGTQTKDASKSSGIPGKGFPK